MIRVTVEIDRFGLGYTNCIGFVDIVNDGTGTKEVGNYDVSTKPAGGRIQKARVEGYQRGDGWLPLVAKALTALAQPGSAPGTDEAPKDVALRDVLAERTRQDSKWGEQNHDPFTYLAILTEEVGELAQCALHSRFGGPEAWNMRTEAVQVAAVALAIVQCLDRGKWSWPK